MFGRLLKPKVDTAFRVNDRGETTLLLSEFPFQPLNGYVVASDEHAAALRRALRKYHRNFLWVIFVCGAGGGAWVAADRTFLPYLLAVLCVAQVYRSAYVRLVFRKILRDCETAPERMGFLEAQAIRAASSTWKQFHLQGLFLLLLLGGAAALSLWQAMGTDLKIAAIVFAVLAALNHACLFALKRRQAHAAGSGATP